ncbi:MAG TPA: hypothetical protein VF603_14645 [Allosphingosinicella sp.]|jgi:hypothetical protein
MILLKSDQLEQFAAVVRSMGARAVIVVTPERSEMYMGGEEPKGERNA